MTCPACGANYSADDNYCRRCGTALRARLPALQARRVPALLPERRVARISAAPLVPLMARGATALLLVKVGEWALRRVVPHLASTLLHASRRALPTDQPLKPESAAGREPLPVGFTQVITFFWRQIQVFDLTPPEPEPPQARKLGFLRRRLLDMMKKP